MTSIPFLNAIIGKLPHGLQAPVAIICCFIAAIIAVVTMGFIIRGFTWLFKNGWNAFGKIKEYFSKDNRRNRRVKRLFKNEERKNKRIKKLGGYTSNDYRRLYIEKLKLERYIEQLEKEKERRSLFSPVVKVQTLSERTVTIESSIYTYLLNNGVVTSDACEILKTKIAHEIGDYLLKEGLIKFIDDYNPESMTQGMKGRVHVVKNT